MGPSNGPGPRACGRAAWNRDVRMRSGTCVLSGCGVLTCWPEGRQKFCAPLPGYPVVSGPLLPGTREFFVTAHFLLFVRGAARSAICCELFQPGRAPLRLRRRVVLCAATGLAAPCLWQPAFRPLPSAPVSGSSGLCARSGLSPRAASGPGFEVVPRIMEGNHERASVKRGARKRLFRSMQCGNLCSHAESSRSPVISHGQARKMTGMPSTAF